MLRHRECGGEADDRRICGRCGAHLELDDVELRPRARRPRAEGRLSTVSRRVPLAGHPARRRRATRPLGRVGRRARGRARRRARGRGAARPGRLRGGRLARLRRVGLRRAGAVARRRAGTGCAPRWRPTSRFWASATARRRWRGARRRGASRAAAGSPLGTRRHARPGTDPGAGPWLQWHVDAFEVPAGARLLAYTDVCPQAFAAGRSVGVQFHPEADEIIVAGWTQAYPESLAAAGTSAASWRPRPRPTRPRRAAPRSRSSTRSPHAPSRVPPCARRSRACRSCPTRCGGSGSPTTSTRSRRSAREADAGRGRDERPTASSGSGAGRGPVPQRHPPGDPALPAPRGRGRARPRDRPRARQRPGRRPPSAEEARHARDAVLHLLGVEGDHGDGRAPARRARRAPHRRPRRASTSPSTPRHGKDAITIAHVLVAPRRRAEPARARRSTSTTSATASCSCEVLCDAKPRVAPGQAARLPRDLRRLHPRRDRRAGHRQGHPRRCSPRRSSTRSASAGPTTASRRDGRRPRSASATPPAPPPLPPMSTLLTRALGRARRRGHARSRNDPRFLTGIVPAGNVVTTANELSRFFELLRARRRARRRADHRAAHDPPRDRRAVLPRDRLHARRAAAPLAWASCSAPSVLSLYGPDTEQAFGHLGFTNILGWADPERALSRRR